MCREHNSIQEVFYHDEESCRGKKRNCSRVMLSPLYLSPFCPFFFLAGGWWLIIPFVFYFPPSSRLFYSHYNKQCTDCLFRWSEQNQWGQEADRRYEANHVSKHRQGRKLILHKSARIHFACCSISSCPLTFVFSYSCSINAIWWDGSINHCQVLERGERLEDVMDKSEKMKDTADQFRKKGRELRRKMWWQNTKMKIVIAVIVLVVLLLIFFGICRGVTCVT